MARLFIILVPTRFSGRSEYCFKMYYIIPIVFQNFSLSLKSPENFDAKEFLEVPLTINLRDKNFIANSIEYQSNPIFNL